MTTRISMALGGAHLHAELRREGRARLACEVGPADETASGISAMFTQALSELTTAAQERLDNAELNVQLGSAHSQVGLMLLEGSSATALAPDVLEACVHAWVAQMLHLDPQGQVIRWRILADAHRVLVSCVSRTAFDALSDAALQHRLRFTGCRPAVLIATTRAELIEHGVDAARALTVVWTEGGSHASRGACVQLLQWGGREVCAFWRGWVPCAEGADGSDAALAGAIERFRVCHRVAAESACKHLHWPLRESHVHA